jgi:hypothetical protein
MFSVSQAVAYLNRLQFEKDQPLLPISGVRVASAASPQHTHCPLYGTHSFIAELQFPAAN